MGFWGFCTRGLEYLFYKVKTIFGIADNSLTLFARKQNISIFTTKGVNDKDTIKILKIIKPTYVIAQVPQKIAPEVLSLAQKGFINKHASLLPKYKGLFPVFWALLNGEKQIGFTFHLMDKKIDTGNILAQKKIRVIPNQSVYCLYKKVFEQAGDSLTKLVIDLEKKRVKPKRMKNSGNYHYYSLPTKEDIKKLADKGFRFV